MRTLLPKLSLFLAFSVFLVPSLTGQNASGIPEVTIPGGEYQMGDHFGFVDPQHPSDELPVHLVKVDTFKMAVTETTNSQFLSFLNAALQQGLIEVKNNIVYLTGGTDILCYTNQFESWYSIGYDGTVFSMADFREKHPMVGVMWPGAAVYCNWFSLQNGLEECYDLSTWGCNFTKNGYRLPTEAEWEFAARGGHTDPYYNYPTGNTVIDSQTNIPESGDPYETGPYPNTTPVGFYDGKLKQKSDYNWPGSASTYQTTDGVNGFGLYDMQGNVWELLNDWYGQNYYSISPYDNPTGPETGFIMPDGKPYRGMRGGNWYNGYTINGVNDGHSRVSNRNPSYYRGPQDPNHPWYHVGFRVVRKYQSSIGIDESGANGTGVGQRIMNFPNPFSHSTSIRYFVPDHSSVTIRITDIFGNEVVRLAENELTDKGWHLKEWEGNMITEGIYLCHFLSGSSHSVVKIIRMN